MRTFSVACAFALTLAACSDPLANVTDEQLLTLLGEERLYDSEDMPRTMARKTEECARLLSGLDEAIFKDAGAEFLGMIKTECRKRLQERLQNGDKNPMGLTLAAFERKTTAERVSALYTKAEENYRTARAEKRQRELEEQTKAVTEQFMAYRAETLEALSAAAALEKAPENCAEYQRLYDLYQSQRHSWSIHRVTFYDICQPSYLNGKVAALGEALDKLNAVRIEASQGRPRFQRAHFGEGEPQYILNNRDRLLKAIEDLKQKTGG